MNIKAGEKLDYGHITRGALPYHLAKLAEMQGLALVIVPSSQEAYRLERECKFFMPDVPILNFPDWEILPYDTFSAHESIVSTRLRTLYTLPSSTRGMIIVPVHTLMHFIAPNSYVHQQVLIHKTGDKLKLDDFSKTLIKAGYKSVNTVYHHGEYAIRGSLLDVFPMGIDNPIRIDLFDDEIDSLRVFDTETQRTLEKIDELCLLPAREFELNDEGIERFRSAYRARFAEGSLHSTIYQDVSEGIATPGIEYYLPLFFEQTATLFDYLPENTKVVTIDGCYDAANDFYNSTKLRYEVRRTDRERPPLKPEEILLSVDAMYSRLKEFGHILLTNKATKYNVTTQRLPDIHLGQKDPFAQFKAFKENNPYRFVVTAESAGRLDSLLELMRKDSLNPLEIDSLSDFLSGKEPCEFAITIAALDAGFIDDFHNLCVITEADLYGDVVMQRRRRGKTTTVTGLAHINELDVGDLVVHIEHGIGRYIGLTTMSIGTSPDEFISIQYAGSDKVFVPVTQLHMVSRYAAADHEHAQLAKLGSGAWERAKRKAKEKISDVATSLLALYAKRQAVEGHSFAPRNEEDEQFARTFGFEETPDQHAAIEQVLTDLENPQPMDRLVCGDVGFGKTEVAMRAAFFVANRGKQVAILVPTTLLAQQHYETFADRFSGWPMRIACLSRFRTQKEQKRILQQLQDGIVDIVVGTHSLLKEDVKFKNLGLIVVDEEHRFGVSHKERLKKIRANTDVLTMTATPIPRTLNMAIAGIRDLSIIATPPLARLSVKTFVRPDSDPLVVEAVQRELMRGGQVYYLHNNVQTIERVKDRITKLVPSARVALAHGQMRERELERVMSEFYHGRANILVCTTIVETGIDVPNANTIIIERADKLGLAQLHQLRGRVGRSHHQAYAYLLTGDARKLTDDANKRLEAIAQHDELGAGFMLATQDLEIRGAGEILGEEQSGQVDAIGYTLYMEMLDKCVKSIKEGTEFDLSLEAVQIDLHIPAIIPEDFIPDPLLRLKLYRRVADCPDSDCLSDLKAEVIDRFGSCPVPLDNLIKLTRLKLVCQQLGITKVDIGNEKGYIEFNKRPNVSPKQIISLLQSEPGRYQMKDSSVLELKKGVEAPKRLDWLATTLAAMQQGE